MNTDKLKSKFKSKQINGKIIYSFDYLINNELTDDDLNNLFDKDSLLYSIVFNMFYHANIKINDNDIYNSIRAKNFYDKYYWKHKYQRDEFENNLTKVIKNIYSYTDYISKNIAQWYMTIYGLKYKYL